MTLPITRYARRTSLRVVMVDDYENHRNDTNLGRRASFDTSPVTNKAFSHRNPPFTDIEALNAFQAFLYNKTMLEKVYAEKFQGIMDEFQDLFDDTVKQGIVDASVTMLKEFFTEEELSGFKKEYELHPESFQTSTIQFFASSKEKLYADVVRRRSEEARVIQRLLEDEDVVLYNCVYENGSRRVVLYYILGTLSLDLTTFRVKGVRRNTQVPTTRLKTQFVDVKPRFDTFIAMRFFNATTDYSELRKKPFLRYILTV
jgi:hypothetical protein